MAIKLPFSPFPVIFGHPPGPNGKNIIIYQYVVLIPVLSQKLNFIACHSWGTLLQ